MAKKLNRKQKKWTLMVYMAGDNNLADEMIAALQLIQASNLATNFTLRVLFDPGGPLKIVTRVGKMKDGSVIESAPVNRRLVLDDAPKFKRVIKKPKPNSTGQETTFFPEPVPARRVKDILQAFVRDTIIEHQADYYMLVLGGHGSGAVGDFLASNRRSSSLNIQDVGEVLDGVRKDLREGPFANKKVKFNGIHILGLDSCLMSMTEVAYEVRSVKFLVGAEGFEPDNGWPYSRILERLNKLAEDSNKAAASKNSPKGKAKAVDPLDPKSVADKIVQTYADNYMDYTDADISTDLAALDLGRIDLVKTKLKRLSAVLKREVKSDDARDAMLLAHWESQGYKDEQYTDLWDFCNRLALRCNKLPLKRREAIVAACNAVKTAIRNEKGKPCLVIRSCYTGAAFQHSHGVSVFFPWSRIVDARGIDDLKHYAQLQFVRRTEWGTFLDAYLDRTQRLVRSGAENEIDPYDKKNDDVDFEESRLNHRRGLFSGKPGNNVRFEEDSGRYDPDWDNMYDPDWDNMYDPDWDNMSGKAAKPIGMKNPPFLWLPYNDGDKRR